MLKTLDAAARTFTPAGAGVAAPVAQTPGDVLTTLRMRNHTLDALFYDVKILSTETIETLHALRGAEGGVLVVTPDPAEAIAFFGTPEQFLAGADPMPRALAVAGVGSSAIGTAAFARNVAAALDAPVAGVVSGYGLRDLVSEALGGWFWFRTRNLLFNAGPSAAASLGASNGLSPWRDAYSPDTEALTTLFQAPEPAFDVIVGHSKGNLSISEALYLSLEDAPDRALALLGHAHLITISAAIYMPKQSRRVTDILGAIDWFGRLNSHAGLPIDIMMDGAWHHTNTDLAASLDVVDAVRRAIA